METRRRIYRKKGIRRWNGNGDNKRIVGKMDETTLSYPKITGKEEEKEVEQILEKKF